MTSAKTTAVFGIAYGGGFDKMKHVSAAIGMLFLSLFGFTPSAGADENVAMISKTILADFIPIDAFVLLESGVGQVRQYPAEAVLQPPESGDAQKERARLFIGAAVPRAVLQEGRATYHYTFFLIGEGGKFAATEIQEWQREDVEKTLSTVARLDTALTEVVQDIRSKEINIDARASKVSLLRERASQVAGVDEIVDLKMQIAAFDGGSDTYSQERARLKDLVSLGRKQKDPADINERLKTLSTQLADAAKATAMADRLNERRKRAAKAMLGRKLSLIREMKEVDERRLAREVLRLRSMRRELEERLRIRSDDENQF